ncbi:MAG: hypothetical protein RI932_393, partial [Pseudomonadota bacterium]
LACVDDALASGKSVLEKNESKKAGQCFARRSECCEMRFAVTAA